MVAEAGLSHEDNVVGHLGLQSVEISDPLVQAPDFLGHVHIQQSLGFDDHHRAAIELDDEIRVVIGKITVGLGIIKLEADGEIVLGKESSLDSRTASRLFSVCSRSISFSISLVRF